MSSNNLAYLAGFFDGEGSIIIKVKSWNGYSHHAIQCSITSNNKDILLSYHILFGGSICEDFLSYKIKNKPLWSWQVSANRALALLQALYPFLRQKQEEARLAIDFQVSKCGWDFVFREMKRLELHELKGNRRELVQYV